MRVSFVCMPTFLGRKLANGKSIFTSSKPFLDSCSLVLASMDRGSGLFIARSSQRLVKTYCLPHNFVLSILCVTHKTTLWLIGSRSMNHQRTRLDCFSLNKKDTRPGLIVFCKIPYSQCCLKYPLIGGLPIYCY